MFGLCFLQQWLLYEALDVIATATPALRSAILKQPKTPTGAILYFGKIGNLICHLIIDRFFPQYPNSPQYPNTHNPGRFLTLDVFFLGDV